MMKKEDLRIVFMGTPEFAVETLKALVENQYPVVAVVTQPDKPVGRHGSVLQPWPSNNTRWNIRFLSYNPKR